MQAYKILYLLTNIKNRHLLRTFGVAANMHIFIWEVAGLCLVCTPTVLKFCGFSRSTQTNAEKGTVIRPRLLPSTSCSSYNPQIILPSVTLYAEIRTASRKKDLFFSDTLERLTNSTHRKYTYFVFCQLPVFLYSAHRIYESISRML